MQMAEMAAGLCMTLISSYLFYSSKIPQRLTVFGTTIKQRYSGLSYTRNPAKRLAGGQHSFKHVFDPLQPCL